MEFHESGAKIQASRRFKTLQAPLTHMGLPTPQRNIWSEVNDQLPYTKTRNRKIYNQKYIKEIYMRNIYRDVYIHRRATRKYMRQKYIREIYMRDVYIHRRATGRYMRQKYMKNI